MKFITPSILDPGQPFVITDFAKESAYGVGSRGFMSIIQAGHETYQNVVKTIAVITRKGKGGKARLEKTELSIPIFIYFENEDNFRKIMPTTPDVRSYASIEPEDTTTSVLDMLKVPTIDFLGWASAITMSIHNTSSKAKYAAWPEDQAHPLNRFRRLPDIYNDDHERIEAQYADPQNRLPVIEQIRRMDSSLFKLKMGYSLRKLDIILNAAEFLVYVNTGEFIPPDQEDKTNEFKFTENQELLEDNLKYHKEVYNQAFKSCSEKKIPMI